MHNGGHYYYYFVPYQEDVNSAIQALRKQQFEAGRYNPAIPFPFDDWPSQTLGTAQGAKHASIEGALEDSEADGTRSILDMERVPSASESSSAPSMDACFAPWAVPKVCEGQSSKGNGIAGL